jgi:hypothetical protein
MAPSEMIGWECGACTFTNEDCTRRNCQMCMAERPEQYVIVAGASESASARTTTVDRLEQAPLAAWSSDAPAVGEAPVAEVVAGVAMEPVRGARRDLSCAGVGINRLRQERREQERQAALREAAAEKVALEEPIAEGVPVLLGGRGGAPSHAGVVPRCVVVKRLVGTLVDVVGTNANNRGRACSRHSCCGAQVAERTMVTFCREQLVFSRRLRGGRDRCLSLRARRTHVQGGLFASPPKSLRTRLRRARRARHVGLHRPMHKCRQAPEVLVQQGVLRGEDCGGAHRGLVYFLITCLVNT